MDPSAPKLTSDEWSALRAEYEAPGANVSKIAERYKVSRRAISKRAAREGWDKGGPTVLDAEIIEELVAAPVAPATLPLAPATHLGEEYGFTPRLQAKVLKKHQREWAELDLIADRVKQIVMDPTWRPHGWTLEVGKPDPGPSLVQRMRQAGELATILNRLGSYYGGKQVREREAAAIDLTKFGGVDAATAESNAQGARMLSRIIALAQATKQSVVLPPEPIDQIIDGEVIRAEPS